MNRRYIGCITKFEGSFYCFVATTNEIIYLLPWQIRTAKIGSRVVLEYRSSASRGDWVVTEVLT